MRADWKPSVFSVADGFGAVEVVWGFVWSVFWTDVVVSAGVAFFDGEVVADTAEFAEADCVAPVEVAVLSVICVFRSVSLAEGSNPRSCG